jgi:hypothetical protein
MPTAQKMEIRDLAARAESLLARDDEVKRQRKALDDEINKTLEEERAAAVEAQLAENVSPQNEHTRRAATSANLRWREARRNMRIRLKELQPRIAEVTAAESLLSAEKAKLQEDARVEADKLSQEKKLRP